MPQFVASNGFAQQVEEFRKQLEYLSERGVEVADDRGTPTRATSYLVEVPNSASGVKTTFDYREEFRKTTGGWLRTRYQYELRTSMPSSPRTQSRRAHHEHERWGIHQHCQSPSSPDDAHYADVERLLQATHEVFVRQFVSASSIDCLGLVPLE